MASFNLASLLDFVLIIFKELESSVRTSFMKFVYRLVSFSCDFLELDSEDLELLFEEEDDDDY